MSLKVLFTDPPFENLDLERNILEEIGAEMINASEFDEKVVDLAKDADGLIVTYHEINDDFINYLENCKIISRTGIGVDNVDIDTATENGIYVTNVPDYCIEEVSTHALYTRTRTRVSQRIKDNFANKSLSKNHLKMIESTGLD